MPAKLTEAKVALKQKEPTRQEPDQKAQVLGKAAVHRRRNKPMVPRI